VAVWANEFQVLWAAVAVVTVYVVNLHWDFTSYWMQLAPAALLASITARGTQPTVDVMRHRSATAHAVFFTKQPAVNVALICDGGYF
jgi:hypothetical protein